MKMAAVGSSVGKLLLQLVELFGKQCSLGVGFDVSEV